MMIPLPIQSKSLMSCANDLGFILGAPEPDPEVMHETSKPKLSFRVESPTALETSGKPWSSSWCRRSATILSLFLMCFLRMQNKMANTTIMQTIAINGTPINNVGLKLFSPFELSSSGSSTENEKYLEICQIKM